MSLARMPVVQSWHPVEARSKKQALVKTNSDKSYSLVVGNESLGYLLPPRVRLRLLERGGAEQWVERTARVVGGATRWTSGALADRIPSDLGLLQGPSWSCPSPGTLGRSKGAQVLS